MALHLHKFHTPWSWKICKHIGTAALHRKVQGIDKQM
jgi:hypothetical protein